MNRDTATKSKVVVFNQVQHLFPHYRIIIYNNDIDDVNDTDFNINYIE